MKKKLLSLLVSALAAPAIMFPIAICNADSNVEETKNPCVEETNFYTKEGVFERYTYTKEYQNGEVIQGNGVTVTLDDGNMFEMLDSTDWNHISDGEKVVVILYDNRTKDLIVDAVIHNIELK